MIIDIHAQLGRHPLFEFEQYLEEVLVNMESYGIDKTFLLPVPRMRFQEANDMVAEAVEQYPDKFLGFFNVNPMDPKALKEFERASSLGLKGLMLDLEFHYSMESPMPTGDRYLPPLLDKAVEYSFPVLISSPNIRVASRTSDNESLQMYRGLDELMERYPDLRMIVDWFWPGIKELCIKHENLYIDTAGAGAGRILQLVSNFGAMRQLFGSNSPRYHPGNHLQTIKWARLTMREKKLILGGNAERIFKDVI